MRLIDADSLMKMIEKYQFGAIRNEYEREIVKENIIGFINNEPTAYDIDKVVEELEENCVMRANSKTFYDNPQKGEYVDEVVLLNKAIEIVKAGGRE